MSIMYEHANLLVFKYTMCTILSNRGWTNYTEPCTNLWIEFQLETKGFIIIVCFIGYIRRLVSKVSNNWFYKNKTRGRLSPIRKMPYVTLYTLETHWQ